MNKKISVIIPTYNRPLELKNCIQSILKQKLLPTEVIVIDDGNLSEYPLKDDCINAGIVYKYSKKKSPGLTESRNIGIKMAIGDIIFFIDDDSVLSENYLEEIIRVYIMKDSPMIGGVGGLVISHKPVKITHRLRSIFDIFFLGCGFQEGMVLPSGFCTDYGKTIFPPRRIKEVDFLSGGAMSFKKEIFNEMTFTDRYRDFGFGEDKDFSLKVSRNYKLIFNPRATLLHMENPIMRPDKESTGRKFVIGRYLFFKEFVKKGWWSWIFFSYAILGYLIVRTIILLVSFNKSEISRLRGIIGAIKDILKGHIKS